MASLPTVNPNQPGQNGRSTRLFNRATLGVYELGSTFKPITIATAMDAGVVTLDRPALRRRRAAPDRPASRIHDDHPIGRRSTCPRC